MTAFRNEPEGDEEFLGLAWTADGAKRLCEEDAAAAAAQRTQIGETHINVDRTVTQAPRTYTSHLVWKGTEESGFYTDSSSTYAWPGSIEGYNVSDAEIHD